MKKVLSILLCIAMTVSMAACGSNSGSSAASGTTGAASTGNNSASGASAAAGTPKKGGTLRYATNSTCTTPGYTPECTNNASLIFLTTAYESLTYYDESGKITGKLATKWETDSKEPSITWTLREGVKFADGTDFDGEAVKTNIEEYQKCNRNETKNVASCQVIDKKTIKMVLKKWNSATLESVGFFVYYMSPTALKDVNKLRSSSCGTGPFQVTKFESGVSVKYAANKSYWQEGKPYLDAVEIYTVNEPTTRASAFQAGEYDIVHMNDLTVAQKLMNNPDYVMETNKSGVGLVGTGLIPNSSDKSSPFADARVRQAMCYAIDAEALCKTFGYGLLKNTNQWAAPGAVTYSSDVKGYPYDVNKAKQLLTEAGYPNGFDTTLTTDAGNKDIFTAAANMLTEAGIRCTVNLVDEAAQVKLYSTGTWKGIMGHFHAISPDLGLYMGRHLDKDGAFYAAGIQHPDEAMDLLNKIRIAPTEKEKVDLEHQMQSLAYDKLALFGKPIFIQNEPIVKYKYVMDDGRSVYHVGTWNIENCWLNK
jgi:ABC-type dipeptide transport system, periplasmic component